MARRLGLVIMDTMENSRQRVPLIDLLDGLVDCAEHRHCWSQTLVQGMQIDSRQLQRGDLFIACVGHNHDARDFVADAVQAGVSAVLVESGPGWRGVRRNHGVPVIAVEELAANSSEIAARFYQRPTDSMTVIGITGTNGKTSCSQLIARLFAAFGHRCGVMGTLGYGTFGQLLETRLTTPDAVFTQMALADMKRQRIEPVVMEVSSIGLHQQRVAAVGFDTAIFTNLSRDHLDYHQSMAAYAASKRKLFTMSGLQHAVINLDDSHGLAMIDAVGSEVDVLTYSMRNHSATVHAESVALTRRGFTARINTPIGRGTINSPLLGSFNVSNLLAVIAAALTYLPRHGELAIADLCERACGLQPIAGRMEIVCEHRQRTVVVDYAHTPDGLRSALSALREHFTGSIWCVFGCGGNRDQGKRPLMGEIAEQYADHLILTDDNPRHEPGDEIINHILSGINHPDAVCVERNRGSAITRAMQQAGAGDVVLIAGKGHESYQEVAGVRTRFSDTRQARLAIRSGSHHGAGGNPRASALSRQPTTRS